jgi:hypothetical protein
MATTDSLNRGRLLRWLAAALYASFCNISALAGNELQMTAQLWEYGSLCRFKDPPNRPKGYLLEIGKKFEVDNIDCGQLSKEVANPVAVRVTVENLGETDTVFSLEGLVGNVVLTPKTGRSVQALALRYWETYTSRYRFASKLIGPWAIGLRPREPVDLVFLFPEGAVGDAVTIGTGHPVRIK